MAERGTAVVFRSVFPDHVGMAVACFVVEDVEDHIALFQPAGSDVLVRTGRRGGPTGRNMFPGGWDGGHAEVPWTGAGLLRVHRRGQPWSVWRWLDPGGWRPGCYVNLEQPWSTGVLGFDSRDWILDLVVAGDGSIEWKDADELDWCESVGSVSRDEAAVIRAAGRQAAAAVAARRWPFDEDWNRWLPDAGWPAIPLTGDVRARALRPEPGVR